MANILISSFVDLPADVFPYIFRYLDMEDMIAFALTCRIFRQMCLDAKVFRKMDLSRCLVSTTQRSKISRFFRDRQLIQHIRELNISNLCVINWQMDNHLEEFISFCPHLEALHVLNCGMSLHRLHRILKQAPKLTSLSWSLWDFTSEDIQFIVKSMESYEEICLKNIKHLHLETLPSSSHIQIAMYLLLSCLRDLEELEIYIWWINMEYCTGWNLPLQADQFIPGFPEASFENELEHLQSLVVVAVGGPLSKIDYDDDHPVFVTYDIYKEELYELVVSVLRKSSSIKWKKVWILPSIGIYTRHLFQDDFQSVEEIVAHPGWSANAVDEMKTFFERICDNSVRSLQLCLPRYSNSIVQFCNPISRVGGHSLKFLRLSVDRLDEIPAEINVFIHSLFSNCSNIRELDLLYCFEKDICESLSELKHLSKVQLMQCAISSKYNGVQVEISKSNLLIFVENCKNITHLDVRGCEGYHGYVLCRLTDDDLLALAKLRNLKSLTLYNIFGIREWSFLKNIMEHCKFLTMLRIRLDNENFSDSHIQILLESAKFLQHLAIRVTVPFLGSEGFWNLLSRAENLQRLCIRNSGMLNISFAVQTLKALPRLHVVHLHSDNIENGEEFHRQMKRMLEEKESDHRFSFEIVTRNRRNTWINDQTGYNMISNKSLPLNKSELCDMIPILDIPRS